MAPETPTFSARSALHTAMSLKKCRQCGCMAETLAALREAPQSDDLTPWPTWTKDLESWSALMEPVRYSCLGCTPCYPADAQNALEPVLAVDIPALPCDVEVEETQWPPVVGEYFVLDKDAAVAVSTTASPDLAVALAKRRPTGLAIVGKTESENIGVDKVVKNIISNSAIRYLIVTGEEATGHASGRTLLALKANGVSGDRVKGSPGKKPVLRNVTLTEVEAFRAQVEVVDLLGVTDVDVISARVAVLAAELTRHCCSADCGCAGSPIPGVEVVTAPVITAAEPADTIPLDPAGYFVVLPLRERGIISVEHYAYDHRLLRTIEGFSARAIYLTVIKEGWISTHSHAAYLGRELTKAEFALGHGLAYVQDGA